LIEDMPAMGKTPTIWRETWRRRSGPSFRDPVVTVMVTGFVGTQSEQIRVVGEAEAAGTPVRQNMTLLDVMIAVGGSDRFRRWQRRDSCVRAAEGSNTTVQRSPD
jgi:polysaccharide export outer membrane protein